jgi:hypothetical protein
MKLMINIKMVLMAASIQKMGYFIQLSMKEPLPPSLQNPQKWVLTLYGGNKKGCICEDGPFSKIAFMIINTTNGINNGMAMLKSMGTINNKKIGFTFLTRLTSEMI